MEMDNRPSKHELEEMVVEVVQFMKKWGCWTNTMILANGNAYMASNSEDDVFRDVSRVKVKENVDPSEYITEEETFEKPEYIFDILTESPLCGINSRREFENEWENLSDEAVEYILENSDELNNIFRYLDRGEAIKNIEGVSEWDPLEWESWDEYVEATGDENVDSTQLSTLFDNYSDYQKFMDGRDDYRMNPQLQEWMKDIAKKMAKDGRLNYTLLIYDGRVLSRIEKEMEQIYEKHNLTFDYAYSWMMYGKTKKCSYLEKSALSCYTD